MTAADHDRRPAAVLLPFGVLEVRRGAAPVHQPVFDFGHSKPTSDVIADALERWWSERKASHAGVTRIHIELDNGPEIASDRTPFMKRMVEFADRHRVAAERAYLPPYHSKYDPIERCGGARERHGNGARLSSVAAALGWAETMTWRGARPRVGEITATDHRGVRLKEAAFRPFFKRLLRSPTVPRWSLCIQPQ